MMRSKIWWLLSLLVIGSLVNSVTWIAHSAGSTAAVAANDMTTLTLATPAIVLTKTVGIDPAICALTDEIDVPAGTEVTYCYEVENTGDVTLNLHDLDDSELGNILSALSYALSPGASAFLTQTTTINATTVNTATWTAYNTGPTDVVTATDTTTVTLAVPAIVLTKTVGTDPAVCALTDEITVPAGAAVTYCYEVENTGEVTLNLHDLDDSELGSILSGLSYAMSPGASVFLTQTAIITATTVNTATWTAYNAGPTDVITAIDTATVTLAVPSIGLTKTVGTDPAVCALTDEITVPAGTDVTYCYEVENTGEVTLNLHDLDDSELGSILSSFSYALSPGASAFLTQTTTLNATTVNTATWTAYNAGPIDVVTVTATATVVVLSRFIFLPLVMKNMP